MVAVAHVPKHRQCLAKTIERFLCLAQIVVNIRNSVLDLRLEIFVLHRLREG